MSHPNLQIKKYGSKKGKKRKEKRQEKGGWNVNDQNNKHEYFKKERKWHLIRNKK